MRPRPRAAARPLVGALHDDLADELSQGRVKRALWREDEEGYRAAGAYLKRPEEHRGAVWEMDHKNLPILVLSPRGPAVTTMVDNGTRALVGWPITLPPHTGAVLTAIWMALVHDPERGLFPAVPPAYRIDCGLDFAAIAISDVIAALVMPMRIERFAKRLSVIPSDRVG